MLAYRHVNAQHVIFNIINIPLINGTRVCATLLL